MGNKNEQVVTISDIEKELVEISENLLAYKKVDATLSEKTIFDTWFYLKEANKKLEKGFIKDACDEVETIISLESSSQCVS